MVLGVIFLRIGTFSLYSVRMILLYILAYLKSDSHENFLLPELWEITCEKRTRETVIKGTRSRSKTFSDSKLCWKKFLQISCPEMD